MRCSTICSIVALVGAGTPAAAQDAVQSDADDIIVTANKIDERLVEVPSAITVYDREFIEDARIRSLRQIDDYAPNVSINQIGQIGGTFISIRGIESNPFIVNRAAVYIDGIPFRDVDAQVLNDAQQIEILRGPQGTLYGANADAGIVLVRTLDPTEELTGYVSAASSVFGNGAIYEGRARLSGALADGVAGSINLAYSHGDSFVRNQASSLGLRGAIRDFNGLARLRIEPADGTQIDIVAYASRLTAPGLYEQEFPALDRAVYDRNYSAFFNGGRTLERFGLINDAPKRTADREWGVGAVLTQDLGAADLTVAASWRRENTSAFGTDLDLTAFAAAAGGDEGRNRFLNIEARLSGGEAGGLRWIAGGNFYRETKRQVLSTLVGPGTFDDFANAPPQFARGRDLAVFGQAIVPVGPFEVTLGGRYDWGRRQRVQEAGSLNLGPLGVFTYNPVNERETFEEFVPRASLSYALGENARIYATAAKGWLPGGFNLEASRLGAAATFGRYGEERLWSYEIGAKAELFDRRLFIGAAVFRIDADAWQEFNVLTSPTGQVLSTNLITSNAAIRSQGAEIEVQARPARGVTVTFAAGYIDANYTRYRFSPTQDFTGNRLKLVPEFDLSASAQYRSESGWFVRGDISVNGSTPLNPDNTAIQGTVARLGFQAGFDAGPYSFRLFGSNLTNVRSAAGQAYQNFLFGNDGTFYAPLGDPRVLGAEAHITF